MQWYNFLYVKKETVHSVHRFTMFWSLKRHWLHKIGNQAWGHSLTVSTKQRSVAAATKWPVWAEQAGQGHAGRRKWSVTRTDQNSIVGQILCSLRAERSIVMQTHYQPSCFVTPDSVLLPSSPPLSLPPLHSSLEHFQYVTVNYKPAALPCSSAD